MKEAAATVVGFAIAPVFPALLLGAMTPLKPEGTDLETILMLFPIGYYFSGLATAVFAVPLFLVARLFNLIRWWTSMIGGLVIGAGISFAFQWPNFDALPDPVTHMLILGSTGAVSGFVFWLIWRQGQPA